MCVCVCVYIYIIYIYIYNIYNEILISRQKMPFTATWMDLQMITLSKVSQKEKDKYHMISLICSLEEKLW